jgi:hypothetical protein
MRPWGHLTGGKMTKQVSDPEFAGALDKFVNDFAKDRGLSWECAVEVLLEKIDELRAEMRKKE